MAKIADDVQSLCVHISRKLVVVEELRSVFRFYELLNGFEVMEDIRCVAQCGNALEELSFRLSEEPDVMEDGIERDAYEIGLSVVCRTSSTS